MVDSKWNDVEIIQKLDAQMEQLNNLKFSSNLYPESVLIQALNDVLPEEWNTFPGFVQYTNKLIYSKKADRIPFTLKIKDKFTNKWNFWIVKSFVNVNNKFYNMNTSDESSVSFPKKSVLMSKQFIDFLRDYCKNNLKDQVQVWIFTGSYLGRQHLDLSKVNKDDLELLDSKDPNDLVMVNFKRKVQEVMVGGVVGGVVGGKE